MQLNGDVAPQRTVAGLPWSGLSPRWGHPWHPMCSYLGAFPAALARSFITMLTDPGEIVLDPFSGRGTTLLEARAAGRMPLASDLNPIAIALTRAKNADVHRDQVVSRLEELASGYDAVLYIPEAQVQSDEIRLIFHDRTLAQLCYLRRKLLRSCNDIDIFLVGAILGIMHGAERQDGTSGYASISMPNTFSMAPDYVRRFVETKQLQRVERNIFELLRLKTLRLFSDGEVLGPPGIVVRTDAKQLSSNPDLSLYRGCVKLALTSPPYLGVVNYAKQNWIRCWFLGEGADDVDGHLDDNLSLQTWLDFMARVVGETAEMLTPDGAMVFVIGDVAKSSRSVMPIAREFLRLIHHGNQFAYVGCLSDHLEIGTKTTRIWGDTKGQATSVDRIIILANKRPSFQTDRLGQALSVSDSIDHSKIDANRLEQMARVFAGGHVALS